MAKLWGGRFSKLTDGMVDDFHSSISFDKRLYQMKQMNAAYQQVLLSAAFF